MATSKLVTGLLALASLLALATADFVHDRPMHRIRRQSPSINVHEIPKTSFSCADKQAGEYYADPEVQCQVYHICVPGVTGKLAKMSFVCPNGTIFSQSSRVCSPYDRVYCALAERFYENVMGEIDTDKEYYHSLRVDAPVFNAIVPPHDQNRQDKRRRPVRPVVEYDDDVDYDATTAPPPPPTSTQRRRTQQQSTQSSARRFQPSQRSQFSRGGSRTQSTTNAPTTTTTTTQRPPAPAFRPSPFRTPVNRGPPQSFTQPPTQTNPTFGTVAPAVVQPNPFSQPPVRASFVPAAIIPANPVSGGGTPPVAPPPIPGNAVASGAVVQQTAPPTLPPQQQNLGSAFRLPQRPHLRRPGASLPTTTTTPPPSTAEYEYYDYEEEAKTAAPRSKRAAAVPVKFVLPPNRHAAVAQTSFSCQDKVAGGVYADPETDCQLFHICVPVGKGKLLDYGLLCDEGTAFNQETGTCDERDSFSCARSLQFTRTDKTKKFLADKKPWAYPKFNKRIVRDVTAQEEVESRSAEVREHGEEEGLLVAAVELPVTSFSCEGRTVGGYYADVETGCRMFHICAQTDMRFLCTNGTVFDQKALVCKNEDEVRCEDSPKHYVNGLTRFLEREKLRPEEDAREQRRADAYEITKVKSKYPKKVGDYKLRRYL
ncbi:uncharacterized protein [Dermacentor andersoni]|uniref:uncharacterized protein n=1 Tax=Dermacentor andersoni TaxID=34620 RepID=UPI0021551613|nr:uncharacterized protein LOC126527084 [Dermacentor andersoni]XP_050030760.1 uncharacterized protein LOC126527084 [Dermacentor andersoni]